MLIQDFFNQLKKILTKKYLFFNHQNGEFLYQISELLNDQSRIL